MIDGITFTKEGTDALEIIQGVFPELSELEHLSILVGVIKENPKLNYIVAQRCALSEFIECTCAECKQEKIMSLGWIGHRNWIINGLCPKCRANKILKGEEYDSISNS